MVNIFTLVLAGAMCLSARAAPFITLDMSYLVDENTQRWGPAQMSPSLNSLVEELGLQGSWLANNYCSGEHVGTHIDAPAHMVTGVKSQFLHEIPLDRLYGPAVRIDVRDNVKNHVDKDYAITLQDIQDHEKKHGAIPEGALVFSCTGYGELYNNTEQFWGNNDTNLGSGWSFPAFGFEAAEFLARERKIRGVASDTPSCDVGSSHEFPVHRELLSKNIWCIEMAAQTCELPPTGATAYAFPLKVKGGSGAPLRIVASWKPGTNRDPNRTDMDDQTTCDKATGRLSTAPGLILVLAVVKMVFLGH